MNRWWNASHGDPSRMHAEALTARTEIEQARQQVADFFGARPREVIFTSGATEAISTAVWGAANRASHQVLSAVEHSAVRLSVQRLCDQPAQSTRTHTQPTAPNQAQPAHTATIVGVDQFGRVSPTDMAAAIQESTAVVHCQWANHEVGTIQPVAEVVQACKQRSPDVLVHLDAASAAGKVAVNFAASGADLMSVSAHKFGGPSGIGALLVRSGLRLVPLLEGGDQERARRAGLENGAAIAGFAAACTVLSHGGLEQEAAQAETQTNLLRRALNELKGVRVFGHPSKRLAHLLCVGISDVEPQAVLIALDKAGVAAHSGSSCASESLEPSPVLKAMQADAQHSLRFSVGWNTTPQNITAAANALTQALTNLRQLQSNG